MAGAFKTIGAIGIRVRPLTKGFSAEARRALESEPELTVRVPVKVNDDALHREARRAIAEENARLNGRESGHARISVPTTLDSSGIRRELVGEVRRIQALLDKSGVKLRIPVTIDTEKARQSVAQSLSQMERDFRRRRDLRLNVEVSLDHAKSQHKFDHFINKNNDTQVDVNANIDKRGRAEAELSFLTRHRTVRIKPVLDMAGVATVVSTLKALAGVGVMTRFKDTIRNTAENIDKLALTVGKYGVVLGNITSLTGQFVSSTMAIGTGIGHLGAYALTAPAAIMALTSVIVSGVAGFSQFKAAVEGDVEALEALPPKARAAAEALQGTWTELQVPAQAAFWEGLGTSIQSMVLGSMETLKKGLSQVASASGGLLAAVFDSWHAMAREGLMSKMFTDTAAGLTKMKPGMRSLIDAISRLGSVGAAHLPRFGDWFARITNTFDRWVRAAEAAGRIDRWFENAAEAAHNLGRVMSDTYGIFKNLTAAAHTSGAGGLGGLADSLERIRKVTGSTEFHSTLATYFAGAREGATALAKALKPLGAALTDLAPTARTVLGVVGKTLAQFTTMVSDVLRNPVFQRGFEALFRGLDDGLRGLSKHAPAVAEVFGRLGTILGDVFRNVLPIVGRGFDLIATALRSLEGPLRTLIPALSSGMGSALGAIGIVLQAITPALSLLAQLIASLPSPVVAAGLAFLTFRKHFAAMNAAGLGPIGRMVDFFRGVPAAAAKAGAATTLAFAAGVRTNAPVLRATMAKEFAFSAPTIAGTGLQRVGATVVAPVGRVASGFKTAAKGIKAAAAGIAAAFGGPWGLAITGATMLLANASNEIEGVSEAASKARETMDRAFSFKKENPYAGWTMYADNARNAIKEINELTKGISDAGGMEGAVFSALGPLNLDIQAFSELMAGVDNNRTRAFTTQLDHLLATTEKMSPNWFERNVLDWVPGVDIKGGEAAAKLHGHLRQIRSDIDSNQLDWEKWIGNPAGIIKLNTAGAKEAIRQFGTVTGETLKQSGVEIRDTQKNLLVGTDALGHLMATSLGTSIEMIDRKGRDFASAIRVFGDETPQGLARAGASMGLSTREITTYLEALGVSGEAAAEAIKFQFGAVTDSSRRIVKVMGEAVPKLKLGSDGYMEVAQALSGVTNINADQLERVLRMTNFDPEASAQKLAAYGASLDDLRALMGAFGESGSSAELALQRVISKVDDSGVAVVAPLLKMNAFAKALEEISKKADDARGRVDAFRDAVDQLNGGQLSAERLVGSMHEAFDGLIESVKSVNEEKINWSSIIGADGRIDQMTKAGRDLFKSVEEAARSTDAVLLDVFTRTYSSTGDFATSMDAASQAMGDQRARLEELMGPLREAGINVDELTKRYGLLSEADWRIDLVSNLPGVNTDLATMLQMLKTAEGGAQIPVPLKNGQETLQSLKSIGASLVQLNDGTWVVEVSADPEKAKQVVEGLTSFAATHPMKADLRLSAHENSISEMQNMIGRRLQSFSLDVPVKANKPSLNDLLIQLDGAFKSLFINVPVGADKPSLLDAIAEAKRRFGEVHANVPVRTDEPVLSGTLSEVARRLGALSANVPVQADQGVLGSTLTDVFNRFNSLSAHVPFHAEPQSIFDAVAWASSVASTAHGSIGFEADHGSLNSVIEAIRNRLAAAALFLQVRSLFGAADGGIVKNGLARFADGGFGLSPKPSAAHIAPAGAYVMYAEKETGGEAFIPLSTAKRDRSTEILARVADMFGYQLASRDAQIRRMAEGGTAGAAVSSGGVGATFNIVNNYPVAEPTSRTVARASRIAAGVGMGG